MPVAQLELERPPPPPALRRRRRLTARFPALFPLAVEVHRLRRHLAWRRSGIRWALDRRPEPLPLRATRHKSLLLRQPGESEMWMQHNEVVNVRLAAASVDGLLIRPGEEFSFCRLVGRASRRKGVSRRDAAGQRRGGGDWYRRNQIWRDVIDRRTGDTVQAELVKTNHALVTYVPDQPDPSSAGAEPGT